MKTNLLLKIISIQWTNDTNGPSVILSDLLLGMFARAWRTCIATSTKLKERKKENKQAIERKKTKTKKN